MKLEFFWRTFKKYLNINFHENPSSGSRFVLCGQTDGQTYMTNLIVAFLNFAKEPKNHIESVEPNQLKHLLVICCLGYLRKDI